MQGCDIICLACQPTYWCIDPFLFLANKFWPEKITVICECNFTPRSYNCDFIKLSISTCPPQVFSNTLIQAMHRTPNEFCIIMLADYWIYKPVNTTNLSKSLDYMISRREVLRTDIGDRIMGSKMTAINDVIYECSEKRDCFLPTSLTPAIWNKKNYLQLLRNGLTPWKTELITRDAYLRSSLRSVWCDPGPISYTNVLRSRDNLALVSRKELIDLIGHYIPKHFKIHYEA